MFEASSPFTLTTGVPVSGVVSLLSLSLLPITTLLLTGGSLPLPTRTKTG